MFNNTFSEIYIVKNLMIFNNNIECVLRYCILINYNIEISIYVDVKIQVNCKKKIILHFFCMFY